MKTINEKSAGQNHYAVSSKKSESATVGVWADNKTEAKKIFKAANPNVALKNVQACKTRWLAER